MKEENCLAFTREELLVIIAMTKEISRLSFQYGLPEEIEENVGGFYPENVLRYMGQIYSYERTRRRAEELLSKYDKKN